MKKWKVILLFVFLLFMGIGLSIPEIFGEEQRENEEGVRRGGGILELFFTLTPPEKGKLIEEFENLTKEISEWLGLPPSIVGLLISFGFPEEIASSALTLGLFWFFPLWFFTLIVGSLLKETLGGFVPKFKESKVSYTTAFFFISILLSTGLIGGFALWLFLNAAALSIYMAFFVFLAGLANRFILKIRESVVSRKALIIGFALIAFFFFLGWIRWVLAWILTVGMYVVALFIFGATYKPYKELVKEQRDRIKVWGAFKSYIRELEGGLTDQQKEQFKNLIDGIHAEWLSGKIPNSAVLREKITEAFQRTRGSVTSR